MSKQVELIQATVNTCSPSASQPLLSAITRPQAPNLAGAVEFSDVKALLKEWITTISGGFAALLLFLMVEFVMWLQVNFC